MSSRIDLGSTIDKQDAAYRLFEVERLRRMRQLAFEEKARWDFSRFQKYDRITGRVVDQSTTAKQAALSIKAMRELDSFAEFLTKKIDELLLAELPPNLIASKGK